MKKVRVLVAIIAAALMIMGVGYAVAWSQVIPAQVNGNVANVSLAFAPMAGSLDGIKVENGVIKISAPNLYPANGTASYAVTVTNNGTVPVRLNDFAITNLVNASNLNFTFGSFTNQISTTLGTADILNTWYKAPIDIPVGGSVNLMFIVSLPQGAVASNYTADPFSFNVNTNFIIH